MAETWKNLSTDSYDAALSLLESERWRSAMSRAYYAVYSRAAALLAAQGVTMPGKYEVPHHANIAAMIVDHLTHLGDRGFRLKIASMVTALYEARVRADYRPSDPVDVRRARTALRLMHELCHYLQEKRQ